MMFNSLAMAIIEKSLISCKVLGDLQIVRNRLADE